ncbi:hypothetical protein DFH06DRAFT_1141389 [Mycena polygramma]|nr:hypothetical protein DFH06DRAFT_1141389 [Mycena polygramma]
MYAYESFAACIQHGKESLGGLETWQLKGIWGKKSCWRAQATLGGAGNEGDEVRIDLAKFAAITLRDQITSFLEIAANLGTQYEIGIGDSKARCTEIHVSKIQKDKKEKGDLKPAKRRKKGHEKARKKAKTQKGAKSSQKRTCKFADELHLVRGETNLAAASAMDHGNIHPTMQAEVEIVHASQRKYGHAVYQGGSGSRKVRRSS